MELSHTFVAPRPLAGQDAKTLALASLGGALEFYDFVIFVFFTAALGHLFFPPDMPEWLGQLQTFGIFAAGYLFRPLGGIVMAHFGDKFGRKRMFTLSVALMAVPTLMIGLLPTYQTLAYGAPLLLLLMRICQGIAIGGEVPGAWVFVSEHVPFKRIGLACSLLTMGLSAGILLGSVVATTVNTAYSKAEILEFAWRIPFLLGGIFGLAVVYLRRWLQETPVFEEISHLKQISKLPIKDLMASNRADIVISVFVSWLITACVVVIMLMTPTLLSRIYQIPMVQTIQANTAATIGLCFGVILMGLACDRFGPSKVAMVGVPCLIAAFYGLYVGVGIHPEWLMPLYAVAGFAAGIVSIVPIVMIRSFPAAVRFTGISVCYNVTYAVAGGLTPVVIPLLTQVTPLAPAHYVALATFCGMVAAIVHGKRTRDRF